MDNKTTLVLALALVAAACGDSVPTPPPGVCTGFGCNDDGSAGAGGGAGGQGGAGGELGACLDDVDCEVDDVCIPSEYDGENIPGEVTDTPGEGTTPPGVCVTLPPRMELSIITFTPMRFTDDGGQRDPKMDDFLTEEGIFDVTSRYATFRRTEEPTAWGPWDLPYRSPPLGFYFYWQAEFSLWVDNIECNLVFGPEGEVIAGAVVREPGKLLCSNNNWLPPQYPDAPGLLVEYKVRRVF
jgi:hypothetical protein